MDLNTLTKYTFLTLWHVPNDNVRAQTCNLPITSSVTWEKKIFGQHNRIWNSMHRTRQSQFLHTVEQVPPSAGVWHLSNF